VLEYAWLLSQTYAMDRSHGAIALGGKVGRSASLLLGLVDVRKKPLLPLTFLGGAAAQRLTAEGTFSKIALVRRSRPPPSNCSAEIVELLVTASSEGTTSSLRQPR